MDDPTRNETALHAIAAQLRTLPARRRIEQHKGGYGLTDAAALAGRLLVEAHRLGAFASAGDVELRNLIDAALAGELEYQRFQRLRPNPNETIPPPPWHAFVATVRWLFTHHNRPYDGSGFGKRELVEGCALLANHIDDRAASLHALAKPAGKRSRKESKMEWLARAILEKKERPEVPDAEIARLVKRHPGTLSRCPEYQEAALRARQTHARTLPKGHVVRERGSKRPTLEAEADDSDD